MDQVGCVVAMAPANATVIVSPGATTYLFPFVNLSPGLIVILSIILDVPPVIISVKVIDAVSRFKIENPPSSQTKENWLTPGSVITVTGVVLLVAPLELYQIFEE